MNPFSYLRASDEADAIARAHAPDAKYLGGGTNLIDLMRETIEKPAVLVDVTHLSRQIEERDGGLWIGAAVRNTALAEHPVIRAKYPMIARAILAGASAQIRNMATVGGNLLQRTRCAYFYDPAARCNKRSPNSGCDAIGGFHRTHAVLGTSDACIASHPSDLCVALAALDATVHVKSDRGERAIPFTQLHVLPGERPEVETTLQPGELIVAVTLPAKAFAKQTYRKVRDRASYAFALVSIAAAIAEDGEVRLALGGVGTVPWRARKAERELRGTLTKDVIRAAIDAELA
ncbi:MAG TPA: xanthine dehydrogenase family protein subunit M, partial [Kofleriaceae bacterium]